MAGLKSSGGSAAGRGLGACYGLAEVGLGSEPGKAGLNLVLRFDLGEFVRSSFPPEHGFIIHYCAYEPRNRVTRVIIKIGIPVIKIYTTPSIIQYCDGENISVVLRCVGCHTNIITSRPSECHASFLLLLLLMYYSV